MSIHKTNQAESDLGDLSFEQALSRLDEAVETLEAGQLPLEEVTQLYESGMRLARFCNDMLAAAELKITQIQTSYGEQMKVPQEGKTQPED